MEIKKYSIEEIYEIVGRDDKTAQLQFIPGTGSFEKFGSDLTVTFLYTQKEREAMDKLVKEKSQTPGFIKAEYLLWELNPELVQELRETGIDSNDISSISYFKGKPDNTFHSKELRSIKKLEIPMKIQGKGRDCDWVYGFKKKLVKENVGLPPKDRNLYLALKIYFDKADLTEAERLEIYKDDDLMYAGVEWEYLKIKLQREEITDDEVKRLAVLLKEKEANDRFILDKYLQEAGSSLQKLVKNNIDQAVDLLLKVSQFHERKFNASGTVPVYLDIDGFLHIYMRHAAEMKINKHFEHKDNFQWAIDDITTVMENVIKEINSELQEYFANNPNKRYSKYGDQSIYFQGDYYTLHIEPSGRISTFHKNKKKAQAVDDVK
ncbi:MAG: hypothetical protein WC615_01500 [Mucilaginibacter sp.]|uniref:hypothetical protein n=1 Tax=Mucilaginibacter sp. TaxID=1882438 RepID=UPI00356A18C9